MASHVRSSGATSSALGGEDVRFESVPVGRQTESPRVLQTFLILTNPNYEGPQSVVSARHNSYAVGQKRTQLRLLIP